MHTKTDVAHFPFMPFPDTFPEYLPKDKLTNWFEHYVEALNTLYWASTEFISGRYDYGLLARLRAMGMRIDSDEDETGHVMKLHRYRGGYYINVGCSELVASREISLLQYEQITAVAATFD